MVVQGGRFFVVNLDPHQHLMSFDPAPSGNPSDMPSFPDLTVYILDHFADMPSGRKNPPVVSSSGIWTLLNKQLISRHLERAMGVEQGEEAEVGPGE
jgi:hypothetical protein